MFSDFSCVWFLFILFTDVLRLFMCLVLLFLFKTLQCLVLVYHSYFQMNLDNFNENLCQGSYVNHRLYISDIVDIEQRKSYHFLQFRRVYGTSKIFGNRTSRLTLAVNSAPRVQCFIVMVLITDKFMGGGGTLKFPPKRIT